MNIRNKLVLYFLISILVPTVIITSVMYIGSIGIINGKMDELTEKNLDSVRLLLQQRLEFVREITILISMNPLVQEALSASPTDDMGANITRIVTLDRALDSYYLSNYYASTSSPIVPTIYLINKSGYQMFDISTRVQDISKIEKKPWYLEIAEKSTGVVASAADDTVYITRRIYDLKNVDTAEYAALLTIGLEKNYFTNLLNAYKTTPGSKILVLNADDTVIMSSDALQNEEIELIQSLMTGTPASFRGKLAGKSVIVSTKQLDNINWRILSITHLAEINSAQNVLTHIVFAVLFICMAIALLMAFLLAKNFSGPILALVKSMRTIRDGNFEIDISYGKKDEFGYLISQYKRMIRQTKELIDKLYISEMNKQRAELQAKEAQLRALQAQMNPHFLYNTLDSINLYAIKYDVPVIGEMINALANFFRYSLSGGKNIITIDEEVRHTRSYLDIQSMRYGTKLRYAFNIPGELRDVRVVKLVMQPLVENAILHGFASQTGELEIVISARREEGKIIIAVQDNGTGADADTLNRLLLAENDNSESFAINNVHQQLRSAFGDEYGLLYRNNENGGITVEITVPAQIHV